MKGKNEIEQEEGKKKLEFFLEQCMPETNPDVTASILDKTFRKMKDGHSSTPAPLVKKKAMRLYYIAVASVAASVIVVLGISLFKETSSANDMRQVVAMMDQLPLEETEEVVLVMPNQESLRLQTDAEVAYSSEGNVSVESTEILPVKESPEVRQDVYDQLIVPKGKRSRLLLSDGTKVWVNSGTKVVYPRVFSPKKREIYVDGEVYLEVTHDANRPFHVNTDGFEVKVLGTSFDVCAYKGMAASKVVLLNGAVEIRDDNNREMRMLPGELVSLEENSITGKTKVNAPDYMAWVNGMMVLDGMALRELAERLSLLYGKEIACDSSLGNEYIYGKLDLRDNLDEILDYIKSMIPLSAHEENGRILLKREK